MPQCVIKKLPQFVIALATICNKIKLPQFVIKRSCPNFVITLAPIGNKKFPNLWYSFASICNNLVLKLVFFANWTWKNYKAVCFDVTMLLMIKFIKTKLCDKISWFQFHFVNPYNSQTKRNGMFRNVVLGSCFLRKGTGTLHQIYKFAVGRALINGAMNRAMLALY